MDATAWVAIAGIAGTFAAPLVSERMRRKSVHAEQLLAQRLVVYADLLRAFAHFTDNAAEWSSIPLADLEELESGELDRLMSQMRVVATKKVFDCANVFSKTAEEFSRSLFTTRLHLQAIRNQGIVDNQESIQQRMALAAMSGKLRETYRKLLAVIRKEMDS